MNTENEENNLTEKDLPLFRAKGYLNFILKDEAVRKIYIKKLIDYYEQSSFANVMSKGLWGFSMGVLGLSIKIDVDFLNGNFAPNISNPAWIVGLSLFSVILSSLLVKRLNVKHSIEDIERNNYKLYTQKYLDNEKATKNYIGSLKFKQFKKLMKYVEEKYPDVLNEINTEIENKKQAKYELLAIKRAKKRAERRKDIIKGIVGVGYGIKDEALSFVPNTKQNEERKYCKLQKLELRKREEEKKKECQNKCDEKYGIL